MRVTAQLYGHFLVSSQANCAGTYLAHPLDRLMHDNMRYFLKTNHSVPHQLGQEVRPKLALSARGYALFDDTVPDKYHSRRIALVRRQCSGNAHGVLAGIGLVNCVYVNPDPFWRIDYRLFAPDTDGKTTLDHVAGLLAQLAPRGITYRTVLLDGWHATMALFKWLLNASKTFYCPLKSNCLVDDSHGQQPSLPVGCLVLSNEEVAQGKTLKVKGMPKGCQLKLFRVLVSTHRTDDLLTNEVEPRDTAAAKQESSGRWTMEPFHRERKQRTGVQACQCWLARSQRNHIALTIRTWTRLKQAAYQTQQTVYQFK